MANRTVSSILAADALAALSRLGDLSDEQKLWLIRDFPGLADWRFEHIPFSCSEERTVVIEGYDPSHKIAVVKAARSAVDLGLKEAKDLVESAPAVLKSGLGEAEAASLARELEAAGATVSIRMTHAS